MVFGTEHPGPATAEPTNEPDFRTRRQRLRDLLASREDGFDLDELREVMDASRGAVLEDLKHLQLTLRNSEEELQCVPPACTDCGFTFKPEQPKAPSKCPECKSKALSWPVFRVATGKA